MQFDFDPRQWRVLQTMFENSAFTEIEARFGIFQSPQKYHTNTHFNGSNDYRRFSSSITPDEFYRIKDYYSKYRWECKVFETEEKTGFPEPFGDVRYIDEDTIIRKARLEVLDLYAYGVRIAKSSELPLTDIERVQCGFDSIKHLYQNIRR